MADDSVIGAFSEAQVWRLTSVTTAQLRRWGRTGFFVASYGIPDSRAPFSHIYSFKDVVALRVLNQLRNVHNVTMPELRKTAAALSHLGEDLWTATTLYVHRGKVVFDEPETAQKREITTGQYVAAIPLAVATASARAAVLDMNKRTKSDIGHVSRTKYVSRSVPVVAGTRIPVRVIKEFREAGYTVAQIAREYPNLTRADIAAALSYVEGSAAA